MPQGPYLQQKKKCAQKIYTTKHPPQKDQALGAMFLAVEPSLLYLLGDPQDLAAVWKGWPGSFKEMWTNCNKSIN